jgi:hypothetical protein
MTIIRFILEKTIQKIDQSIDFEEEKIDTKEYLKFFPFYMICCQLVTIRTKLNLPNHNNFLHDLEILANKLKKMNLVRDNFVKFSSHLLFHNYSNVMMEVFVIDRNDSKVLKLFIQNNGNDSLKENHYEINNFIQIDSFELLQDISNELIIWPSLHFFWTCLFTNKTNDGGLIETSKLFESIINVFENFDVPHQFCQNESSLFQFFRYHDMFLQIEFQNQR